MSIAQVGMIYSGSANWGNNVAAALGVSPGANFSAQATAPGTPATTSGGTTSDVMEAGLFDFSSLLSGSTPLYLAGAAVAAALLFWAVSD